MQPKVWEKSVRAFLVIFVIFALIFLVKYTFLYMYPFIVIILIATFLHPIVSYFEHRWKMSRGLTTLLVMSSFFTVFILAGYFLFLKLLQEMMLLLDSLPAILKQMKITSLTLMQNIYLTSIARFPLLKEWKMEEDMDMLIDKIGLVSINLLKSIVYNISELFNSISYVGFISVFIILAVYMVTKDFNPIKDKCKKMFPHRVIELCHTLLVHLKRSVSGLIKAQIIITLLSTLVIFIGLLIFQTDHLIIITLIIFFVDFIPYLGIGVIFIPWILYSFFTNDYVSTLQLSILYVSVIVIRQILEPKLIATKIGIHPFIALSILFLGIQLFGIVGIFLTPIFLIFFSAFYQSGIFRLLWNFIHYK